MQMTDGEHGEISELCPALAESEIYAAADIDHQFRLLTCPKEIAGRCPLRVGRGIAGAKDLHRQRIACARLSGCAVGHHHANQETKSKRADHRQLLSLT